MITRQEKGTRGQCKNTLRVMLFRLYYLYIFYEAYPNEDFQSSALLQYRLRAHPFAADFAKHPSPLLRNQQRRGM